MKLSLALVGLAAAQGAAEDEKKFATNHGGFLDQDLVWFNDKSPKKMMAKIKERTPSILSNYLDIIVGDPAQGNAKWMYPINDRFTLFLTRLQAQMKRQANKCLKLEGTPNEVARKRRDNNDPRQLFNGNDFSGKAIEDFWGIFWHHATYIREALMQNEDCNQAVAAKLMRRVDRIRFGLVWNYCRKIDDSDNDCAWIEKWNWGPNKGEKRQHPRKWESLQEGGEYSHDGEY